VERLGVFRVQALPAEEEHTIGSHGRGLEERAEEERHREAGLVLYWGVDSVLIDQLAKTAA